MSWSYFWGRGQETDGEQKLDSGVIFDHIREIFEDLPYEFLSEDGLVEAIYNAVNEDSYNFLNSDELSGPMAEMDTIFDEIYLEVESHNLNQDFSVELSGIASGHHRKETDIRGRDLDVSVTALCKPVLGSFGFSAPEYEISGSPKDYFHISDYSKN